MGERVASLDTAIAAIEAQRVAVAAAATDNEGGGEHEYELIAVANHTGGTGGGRHVTLPPLRSTSASSAARWADSSVMWHV